MQLSFNLEDISYLKLDFVEGGNKKTIQLALKEKRENEFITLIDSVDFGYIETPQKVSLDIITNDGMYKTKTTLRETRTENGHTYFIIENPASLDYQQNREYYRILAEYDCIYTVDDGVNVESYNATTYDISAGGVSIIVSENAISQEGMSIVICMPEKDIKSHLKFIRCEMHEDDYKLSFEFTDLSDRDYEYLSDLCVKKQLS